MHNPEEKLSRNNPWTQKYKVGANLSCIFYGRKTQKLPVSNKKTKREEN